MYRNINKLKSESVRRENDFHEKFRRKQKLMGYFKAKYGVSFTKLEFDSLSIADLIKLGHEKCIRMAAIKRENSAATTIQNAYRTYVAKQRYKEYAQQYQLSQERIIAAMKIQYFYRSVKKAKQMEVETKEKKILHKKKHHMINFFTDYIIRFKYLKPRLFALLKQLDRLLEKKRKNLVVSHYSITHINF